MELKLRGTKLGVKCCESPLAASKQQILLFSREEGVPLEPDGPDPPAHSESPTINRIKLGKNSLCYSNMTLDVTHALHLLLVPLSWSPHGNVMYSLFPSTPGDSSYGGISGGHIVRAPGGAPHTSRNACSPGFDTSVWKGWDRRTVSTAPMALQDRGGYLGITHQSQDS